METTFQLDKMSRADKLRLMEALWEDLSKDSDGVESPAWHRDELNARQERIDSGEVTFSDWNEAKRRLRDSTS